MEFTRAERAGQAVVVAVALVFAVAVVGFLFRGGRSVDDVGASPGPSAGATAKAPEVAVTHDTCCAQTARFFHATWQSSARVTSAKLAVTPDPGFACDAAVDATGMKGTIGCAGLLKGATDYVAKLSVTTAAGTFPVDHPFKTMGDTLTGVKWFTEFEDPAGDPLACAAASCRIIQFYTTGKDPLTAQAILDTGRQFNKSNDPGLDPAAIATVMQRMDARNHYHYYRFDTREDATLASVYWLVRSGKPVMVISLAGQHGPVVMGFQGTYGTYYNDPTNNVTAVVVEDPQRGDLDPRTQSHRPDKYRTQGFQTGQPVGLTEWYGDEWWLRFAYASPIRMPDGSLRPVDRTDGAYPTPHWAGKFVILVDDADAENPSDREGQVKFR
ncbi:MAG TPA: hypothetical protein VKE23_11190 [Candidatus Limnocylindria bacterium]|nr:hypothetical protein [Candidatus Limnocylindria bacterium]